MRRILTIIVLLTMCLFLISSCGGGGGSGIIPTTGSGGGSGTNTITGTVYDLSGPSGVPLGGVTVSVRNSAGTTLSSSTSANDGSFTITNIPGSVSVYLNTSKTGYVSFNSELFISSNVTTNLIIISENAMKGSADAFYGSVGGTSWQDAFYASKCWFGFDIVNSAGSDIPGITVTATSSGPIIKYNNGNDLFTTTAPTVSSIENPLVGGYSSTPGVYTFILSDTLSTLNVTLPLVPGEITYHAAIWNSSPPPSNTALFNNPIAVASDGSSLYVVEYTNHTIRKIAIATGATTTLAGTAGLSGSADGTGAAARFKNPQGAVMLGSSLYVADSANNLIRKINPANGDVTTLAGIADGFSVSLDGTGSAARFAGPMGITTDGTDIYVTDFISHTIRKVTTAGVVTTIAGTNGFSGSSNGTGLAASFNGPTGITTDGTNLYVTDGNNFLIRKIVIGTGVVTTLAGSGSSGSADNANGLLASFSQTFGPTNDGTNLYVSDTVNQTIRSINMATGATTTLAGTAGSPGSTNGTGAAASFRGPKGMVRVGGNLYVAEFLNHTIRKIVISTAGVTTFAGTAGVSGSTN